MNIFQFYDNEWYFNEFYKATDQNSAEYVYRLSVGYYMAQ